MTLDIMPDSGTQLIFPFQLDNPELSPALKIKLTNSDGFWVPTTTDEVKLLKGQNTLTILGLAGSDNPTSQLPVYLGTLFISIGGYNLSIALKTSYNPKSIVTNIVFNIPVENRDHMIEKSVKRYTDKLDSEYKVKMDEIDILAREHALKHVGVMALSDPDTTSFRIENDVHIDSNRLVVNADEIANYADQFYVLIFDIDNFSSVDLKVNSYNVSGMFDSTDRDFRGNFNCRDIIRSDGSYRCTFTTQDSSILDASEYSLKIATDRGEGVMTW